jgi:hypothetical protein
VNLEGKNPRGFLVQWATGMADFSEERLAELIATLPPVPPGWVSAAVELPRARAAIDELTARATADHAARQAILADLAAALRGAGAEPYPRLVESLRARLSGVE